MCETLSNFNIATEDTPSCVLTEDMFDAAMNQQFSSQNDVESEDDLSSQEETMQVDRDTLGSSFHTSEGVVVSNPLEKNTIITSGAREHSSGCDSPAVSVLVIETGLDKQSGNSWENMQTGLIDNSNTVDKDRIVNHHKTNLDNNNIQDTPGSNSKSDKLPLLKKILTNSSIKEGTSSDPIDLCDSDESSADDELPGVELIDNELKSVMENNLMAEIGININKHKLPEPEKTTETSPPKIAVKSMAQVPTNIFNTLPQKNISNVSNSELITTSMKTVNNISNVRLGGEPQQISEIPTTIHINRIAVPHQTFVNSQGQKMKCVYVRNSNAMPLVINSNTSSTSRAPKYLAPQLRKVPPKQVPPIVALSQMALKNINQKKTIVAKVPSKMLMVAPKLQKLQVLKNVPQRPHQFHLDESLDSLIKSLLFHNLKKPYNPPVELAPSVPTATCLDCHDRFVLQSSLKQHLARRSLSICYWCRICKVELQFFNRCVFLKHLRGHSCSIKNVDTSCITFSCLSKEMIESGIASTFLKECNNNLPTKESTVQKNINSEVQNKNKSANTIGLTEKSSSVIVMNPANTKITSVNDQSMGVCVETKSSASFIKPISSPSISSGYLQKKLPRLLPKKPVTSLVIQNVKKQDKDLSAMLNTDAHNVLLVCNPVQGSSNVKLNTQTNTSPSKVVPETECIDIDDDGIVDDDTVRVIGNNGEDENDVENDTESTALIVESGIKQKDKATVKSNSSSLRRFCSECGTSCLNINKHLSGTNRPINPKLFCEVCKLILPTKCALKIHGRIHLKLPPYKCPDCGKDFNTWDDLNSHIKFSCGHLAKCVRFMCLSCKAHFASPHNLGNHIINSHSRNIFKCVCCPVAFYSSDSLNKHLTTIHPNNHVIGMDYKQCTMCPKKLVPIDKFVTHVQSHTNINNVLIYGYKCPVCSIVFANKTAFVIHQIKEKKEMEEKAATTDFIKVINKRKTKQRNQEPADSLQNVNQVSDSNSDVEEEPVIVRKFPEPEDDSVLAEKDPLSLDGWEHPMEQQVHEKREELCIVCKKNSVILLPGINLNDQSLCCKQCVKPLDGVYSKSHKQIKYNNGIPFNKSESTRNGFKKAIKHKQNAPKTVQRSYSCDDAKTINRKRKSPDFSESKVKVRRHHYPSGTAVKKSRKKSHKDKKALGKGKTQIHGQVVASKTPNQLICAKCEFVADTKEAFLDHIIVHRTDPNTFQCSECGLCFVVLPSLERHLQINHGIKDVNLYTDNNMPSRSSLSPKVDSAEVETDDHQCQVCYKIFDCISSLEKHFRSHGMAFMNSLTKSP